MPNSEKKLRDRQERFCREYIIDYNATQAAIRAGYTEKTAYSQGQRLLKYAEILARVRELQKEQAERLAVSADWVVIQLVEVYKRCMQAEEVLVWDSEAKAKVPSGTYTFDSKGALNALEMIGKHLSMFMPKDGNKGQKADVSKLYQALIGGEIK